MQATINLRGPRTVLTCSAGLSGSFTAGRPAAPQFSPAAYGPSCTGCSPILCTAHAMLLPSASGAESAWSGGLGGKIGQSADSRSRRASQRKTLCTNPQKAGDPAGTESDAPGVRLLLIGALPVSFAHTLKPAQVSDRYPVSPSPSTR